MNGTRTCSVDGCDRDFYAHELCSMHWRRVRDTGEVGPAKSLRRRKWTAKDRILDRINIDPVTECWNWQGAKFASGYGQVWSDGRGWGAHRLSWMAFVGPIADDLVLDHLCRNRACVNPAHLEPCSAVENTKRGVPFHVKERCPKGHLLTPDNLRVTGTGYKMCRICSREWRKAAYQKRKELGLPTQSKSYYAKRDAARAARAV